MTNIARRDYYQKIAGSGLAPLWENLHALVPRQPTPACQSALWRYDSIRPLISEAGRIISAEEAERRVLVLENPAFVGQSKITNSLYGGCQMILPGEIAPSHRHTQSAMRFVMEGEGGYTAVDGEKAYMSPGDLILTPPWTWHDHGNDGDCEMIWFDALDIPMVAFFDAGFSEPLGARAQLVSRPEGDSFARYGSNLLPVDYRPGAVSPVFSYPYDRTREALETMKQRQEWDPCLGLKLRFIDPTSGSHAMPTMAAFIQMIPAGVTTSHYRSTDSTVYIGVEGQGTVVIGDQRHHWGVNDIFVVPSWVPVHLK